MKNNEKIELNNCTSIFLQIAYCSAMSLIFTSCMEVRGESFESPH